MFNQLFRRTPPVDLQSIIKAGAFLVDVRTPGEFVTGNVKSSVNIPLDTIPGQLARFKNKSTIVVFCRSGGRSSQAKAFLEQNGFTNIINGGTWENVNRFANF